MIRKVATAPAITATLRAMLRAALLCATLAAAGGCQTFIGIEDVQGHLPEMDGDYLVGLHRVRADRTVERLRLVGSARLDPASRELDISLTMRSATNGAVVSENAISDLVFPEDSVEVEFDLSINVRDEAVLTPMTDEADRLVAARMRMRLEGDFSFCATAIGGDPAFAPSIGSILVATEPSTVPESDLFDVQCNDL